MALSAEQKAFFQEYGYLEYDKRVLSESEITALQQRSEEIVAGQRTHIPPRFIQLEAKFRNNDDPTTEMLDKVRKMPQLCYFDDLFGAVAKKAAISVAHSQ